MAQNYSYSSDSSESITSGSELIITEEIFPGFNKTKELKTPPCSSTRTKYKRKVKEYNTSSDSDDAELFTIDHSKRAFNIYEKAEEQRIVSLKDGFYPCEVCCAYFKTYKIYEAHLNDRSHKREFRKIREKEQSHKESSSKVVGKTVSDEKKPPVPPGIIRRRVLDESVIQDIVETDLSPCPGLEHVTEIRGLKETIYYCAVCKSTYSTEKILSHLGNHKHLAKSLKAIAPMTYDDLYHVHKRKRKRYLYFSLAQIQQKDGIGRIIVEKDYLDDSASKKKSYLQNPEMLSANSDDSLFCECHTYPRSDYFCNLCEVSMFNSKISESHAKGSLIRKNVKKSASASNLRVISLSKSKAFLVARLEDEDTAVVGLDFLYEFQHFEDKKETYHCFICRKCLSFLDIVTHVTSMSHRIKYLEHINHHSIDHVRRLDLTSNRAYYLLGEICRKIQVEIGEGWPRVFLIKKFLVDGDTESSCAT